MTTTLSHDIKLLGQQAAVILMMMQWLHCLQISMCYDKLCTNSEQRFYFSVLNLCEIKDLNAPIVRFYCKHFGCLQFTAKLKKMYTCTEQGSFSYQVVTVFFNCCKTLHRQGRFLSQCITSIHFSIQTRLCFNLWSCTNSSFGKYRYISWLHIEYIVYVQNPLG